MRSKRTLVMLMAAGLMVAVAPVAAYADDVTVTGNYTVPKGTTIHGDLTVTDGYIHIYGTVEGNVTQYGPGRVKVFWWGDGGRRGGQGQRHRMGRRRPDRKGLGRGQRHRARQRPIRVSWGQLEGNASEWDSGALEVARWGEVEGNAFERGRGRLTVRGYLHGNAEEWEKGSIVISCGILACDDGSGNPVINGIVDGDAIERNYGNIVIDPGTALNGDAEENGPGEVIDNR